jgi:hypothetical protein
MTSADTSPVQLEEKPQVIIERAKRKVFLTWITSITAVLFLCLSTWLNTVEIPELRDDLGYQRDTIFSLTEEIERLQKYVVVGEQRVAHLETQIAPFRILARQIYGSDETEALKQLSEDVKRLEKGPEQYRRPG